MRTRRYSQYNAKRRCFDTERHVINRGSVLRFELSQPLTDEALTGLTVQGLYQESGLGQMSVNSPILAHRHPSFSKLASNPKLSTKGEAPLAQPQTPANYVTQQKEQYLIKDIFPQTVLALRGSYFSSTVIAL